MVDIGLRIRDLIHQKKITKADLARRMERTPQSINKLLSKSSMNTDSLQKILDVTGIKSSEIFEVEEIELFESEEQNPAILPDKKVLEENSQLKMDLALCKKDVQFYKSQAEEKERTIEILRGKE